MASRLVFGDAAAEDRDHSWSGVPSVDRPMRVSTAGDHGGVGSCRDLHGESAGDRRFIP